MVQTTKTKLDKSDYSDIGLIILFSLYAYFFIGNLFAVFFNSGVVQETSGYSILTWIVPLLIIAWTIFRPKSNSITNSSNYGFTLGKQCWIHLGVILVIEILILNTYWDVLSFNLESASLILPIILNVTAATIVLRAVLIELIQKIYGKGKLRIYLIVLLSTLLFIAVMTDINSFEFIIIVYFSASAFLYDGTRCLLVPIVWDAFMLFKILENNMILPFIVITILLYFAIAIPIHFIQKQKQKQKQKENVIQT